MSILRMLSWTVFAGVAMYAAMASAQDPLMPKDGMPKIPGAENPKDGRVIPVRVNDTKTIGMTRAPGAAEDPIIEKVQNENPRVCRIQSIFNDPRHVLITGLAPGVSKVTFTGYTDPNGKDRHEEVFEVRVTSPDAEMREQLRKDFLNLVRKTAPTANVDATIIYQTTQGPLRVDSTSANNAETITKSGLTDNRMVVFLTGNVMSADTVNTILESARAIFGGTAQIVNNMTVGSVQQVEVDCTICSINRSKARSMSFSWSINRPDFFLNSILPGSAGSFTNAVTSSIATVTATQTNTGGNVIFGSVTNSGAFFGFLQALRTDGLAKLQAEPKVVTLSGRPAQFISGGSIPVVTTSLAGSQVTQLNFGTTITVLPIVLGNGKIHLEVAPQISAPNASLSISTATTTAPALDIQGAQVAVQLEDGQTIAIGGLLKHTTAGTLVKVPVLGDLPMIGAAFRSVTYKDTEEELIILVTPRLVDPMSCEQLASKLPTRLTRSPDDFELYLEGMLELPRGPRQTCGPNGCYAAPHQNGPTAGLYPCGDQSNVPGLHRAGNGLLHGNRCATGNCGVAPGVGCANGVCNVNGAVASPTMAPATLAPAGPQVAPQSAPQAVPQGMPQAAPQQFVPPAPNPVPAPLPQGNQPPLPPQSGLMPSLPPTPVYQAPTQNELPPATLAPVSYNLMPEGTSPVGAPSPIHAPALRFPNPNGPELQ